MHNRYLSKERIRKRYQLTVGMCIYVVNIDKLFKYNCTTRGILLKAHIADIDNIIDN